MCCSRHSKYLLEARIIRSSREFAGEYIGGRTGVTITPSLLGEPYIDFGYLGVFAVPAIIAFVLAVLCRWQHRALTWAPRLAYCYTLAIMLLDVHSGLLDPQSFVSIAIMILFARRAERVASRRRRAQERSALLRPKYALANEA